MAAPVLVAGLVAGAVALSGFVVVMGSGTDTQAMSPQATQPSALAASAVPDQAYVAWLEQAGALCPQVSAPLLAAQIQVESGWDPNDISSAGAEGLSQFMPGTWPSWDQPPAVPGPDTPFVPPDAIMAQGRYDCALAQALAPLAGGAGADVTSLVLAAYNAGSQAVLDAGGIPPIPETEAYVSAVEGGVAAYAEQLGGPGAGPGETTFAQAVVAAAQQWIGTPYSWGGGNYQGPSLGVGTGVQTVGFDCSGLVMYAVYQASDGSIALPHSSELQATMGQAVDSGTGPRSCPAACFSPVT